MKRPTPDQVARVPKGVPTGGQFAPGERSEVELDLSANDDFGYADWDDDGYGGMTRTLSNGTVLEVRPFDDEDWVDGPYRFEVRAPDGTVEYRGVGEDMDDAMTSAEGLSQETRREVLAGLWGPSIDETDLVNRGALAGPDVSPSYREPSSDEHHAFLRGLPSYVEVDVVFEATPDRHTRLMARDMPRGAGEDHRRFTQLDAGLELFMGEDSSAVSDYGRVAQVQRVKAETLRAAWPEHWGAAYIGDDMVRNEFNADQFLALRSELSTTNHPIRGDFYDSAGNVVTDAEFVQCDSYADAGEGQRQPRVVVWDADSNTGFSVPVNRVKAWRNALEF